MLLIISEKHTADGTLTIKPDLLSNLLQGVFENIPATPNRQTLPIPQRDKRQQLKQNLGTFSPESFVRYKDELLRYVLHEEHVLSSRASDLDDLNGPNKTQKKRLVTTNTTTTDDEEELKEKEKEFSDVSWPDPDPNPGTNQIMVDDVTQLNHAPVSGVFFPRTIDDVKHILALARKEGKKVSMRGTKHSMGGHTIAENGFVIDTAKLNNIIYDKDTRQATVGPGVVWSDLVYHLNQFGMSPVTLQSYSSFSVGGSISVNAHGITSDFCLHQSVIKFTLIRWDGTEIVCKDGAHGESGELFRLALGGYGMFGVIVEITMDVQPNARLRMDVIQTKADDLYQTYQNLIKSEEYTLFKKE